jgi:iron-sulfur cluster assembly accessory protein
MMGRGYHGGMSVETETPVLSVTARAAEKAISLAEREGYEQPRLRVRVVAGGCSGFSTKLSFEQASAPDDLVIEAHGLSVLVDPKSIPIMAGSTLEYSDAMLGGGFRVENPRAVHRCACGESFSV